METLLLALAMVGGKLTILSSLLVGVIGMAVALDLYRFANASLSPGGLIGAPIASAATIAPTYGIHHVTGTAAIVTITPPATDFQGTIGLIADAIWTWTAAGNIGIAGTTTAAGKIVWFTYDPATAKWYPDKIA